MSAEFAASLLQKRDPVATGKSMHEASLRTPFSKRRLSISFAEITTNVTQELATHLQSRRRRGSAPNVAPSESVPDVEIALAADDLEDKPFGKPRGRAQPDTCENCTPC